MNWKSTVALLAVVIALVAYFKLYEEKQPGSRDLGANRVVVLDRDQVDGLTILNHDLKIDLRRNGAGEWEMKSPIADRADVSLINQVMTDLETMHKEDTISADEIASNKSKLQDFGLQSPRLQLQVTPKGGTAANNLVFGNETAIDGKTYMQVTGRNDVYVVGSDLKKLLDKDVNAWRDHRLTELAATEVNKVSVKNAAGELELQRVADHWQIAKPLNARASDQKVNDLVSQLTNMTVGTFVADDKADAATYGLADPRGMVTLYTPKDPKGTELIIGTPKPAAAPDKNNPAASAVPVVPAADGSVYLRMPSRQSIYTVAKGVEDFLNLKPNDLRDRQLVRLNPDTVDRIKITPANGAPFTLGRKEKQWSLLGPPADQPANPAEADKLMQSLSQATVSAFVADSASDLAKYGLDKPQLKVGFSSFASENTAESNAGEKPLATVSFGKVDEPNVYARVEEEPFILSVPRSVMDAVPTDRSQWQPLNIFQGDADKIGSISISTQGQPEVSLTRKDKGLWTLAKGTGPLDESRAQSVANTLARLHATRWIGGTLPPESGLEPAPAFATLRFETPGDAKNSGVVFLGHTGPENMGYARVEGRPGTFLVSRPDYDTLLQPLVPGPAPTPTPAPIPTTPEPTVAPAATPEPVQMPTPASVPNPLLVPVPTPLATPVATATPSPTSAPVPVATPTPMATATPMVTPELTPVPTPVPSPVSTPTPTPEPTPTPTPVPTASPTPAATMTPAATPTPTPEPTATPATPTPTPVPTLPVMEPTPSPTPIAAPADPTTTPPAAVPMTAAQRHRKQGRDGSPSRSLIVCLCGNDSPNQDNVQPDKPMGPARRANPYLVYDRRLMPPEQRPALLSKAPTNPASSCLHSPSDHGYRKK